jgi:hypothetical protein
MISFLGTIIATQPATTGHISVSRDIIRDWRRWSRAERAAAVFVTVECPGADNRREAGYSTLRSSLFHARTPSASNRRTFGGSTSHSAEYRQTFEMDRIFIADGPVWTSAGMTAGIDLALGLIERDLGQQAAQRTARCLSSIIAALAVNRSIPQCCSSMPNPIAFKLRWPSQSRTFANR